MRLTATARAPGGPRWRVPPAGDPELPYWLALGLAGVALPFFLVEFVPFYVFPDWLYQAWLLRAYAGAPALHQAYELLLVPIPNVAAPLLIAAVGTVLPLRLAGKVVVVLAVVLFAVSFAVLARVVHGRRSPLEPLLPAFGYSFFVYWASLSYYVSIGLAIFGLALAIRLDRHHRPPPIGWLLLGTLVLLTYFAHLLGWAILATGIGVLALRRLALGGGWGRAALTLLPLAPTVALLAVYLGHRSTGTVVYYSSLLQKLPSFVMPLFVATRVDPFPSLVPVAAVNGLFLVAFALVVALSWAPFPILAARRYESALIFAGAILLAVAAAIPVVWIGGIGRPDERFVLPPVLLVTIALAGRPARRLTDGLAATAMGVVVISGAVTLANASPYLSATTALFDASWTPGTGRTLSIALKAPPVRSGCDRAAFNPLAIGTWALQSASLYPLLDASPPVTATTFDTALLRERPGAVFDVAQREISEGDFDRLGEVLAQERGALARTYVWLLVNACPEPLDDAVAALAPQFRLVARTPYQAVLRRAPDAV